MFYHELAHCLLHKRVGIDGKAPDLPHEQQEKEAELFANEMLLRLGESFVWDALQGNLSYSEEQRAKSEITKLANSALFRRNQVKAEPYQRASQGDVEVKWHRQLQASVHHRQRMTASELEAQGRRELALAAKVKDPRVAEMIRRSGNEKLGHTSIYGRRSGASYADVPFETATLRR